ncbi:M14 family zinc carboxypeptidase [Elizabethkingia sp. JS20170427COW]|uniref:M14 family zinc carboxypeptidase n=1 Tax=Elizabethkingia sp. JS20170427COW TaxID=2583851 RepID=UPI001110AFFA|nr:M14 family zinc carboxypeptidase [Elizabethkingia sp. JS20170427COW]QCX54512.1 peptidase M14 [Elizabethkingia sp. JS20170427COW]
MNSKFKYFTDVNFPNRYISPEKLFSYLQDNYGQNIELVGKSVLGLPIYKFSKGSRNVKVLAWSQMHGNESTATLAMLDLLYGFQQEPELGEALFEKISLDFIFMLNPDGSKVWTRRNACDVDMNRDFLKEASPEIRILKEIANSKKYDYALNLHDQRTIFTTDGKHPATLSFLAPSFDVERSLNENRKKSMAIISYIYTSLENKMPNRIGRYSDEFYPMSTGDNFMLSGLPTILFEGGHSENDYLRKDTRKYYTHALYYALAGMSLIPNQTYNYESYFDIPQNKESHYDIIYRNVKLNTDFHCVLDIAVQYKEVIKEGEKEISFIPIIAEVGDLSRKKAWKDIDASALKIISETKFPKIDQEVNFSFEEIL